MRHWKLAWIPLTLVLGCNDQGMGGETISPEDLAPRASENAQPSAQRQRDVAEETTLQQYPPPDALQTQAQGPTEPEAAQTKAPPGPPAQTLRIRMAPVISNLCGLDRSIEVIPLDAEGGMTSVPEDGLMPELIACLTVGPLSKGVVEVKAYPSSRRPADKALADENARALWMQEYLQEQGVTLERIQTGTIVHASERLGDSTTEPTIIISVAT